MSLENLGFYCNSSVILQENSGSFLPTQLPMNSFQGLCHFQQSFGNYSSPLLSKRSNQYELSDALEKRVRMSDGATRVEIVPVHSSNLLNNDQHLYQIGDLTSQANCRREAINSTIGMGMNDISSLHWQISQQIANVKGSVMDPLLHVIPASDMGFGGWSYPTSQPIMLQEGQLFQQSQINAPTNNLNINESSQIQFILAPYFVSLPPNPIIILDQFNPGLPLNPHSQLDALALSSVAFNQNNSVMNINQNISPVIVEQQAECFATLLRTNNNSDFSLNEGVFNNIPVKERTEIVQKINKDEVKNSIQLDKMDSDSTATSFDERHQEAESKNSNQMTRIKSFVDLMRRKKEKLRTNESEIEKKFSEGKGAIEIKSFEFDQNPRKRRNLRLRWSPENNGNEFLKLAEEIEKILQIDINHEKLTKIFQENGYNINKTIELVQSNSKKYTKFFDLRQRRQRFPSSNAFSF